MELELRVQSPIKNEKLSTKTPILLEIADLPWLSHHGWRSDYRIKIMHYWNPIANLHNLQKLKKSFELNIETGLVLSSSFGNNFHPLHSLFPVIFFLSFSYDIARILFINILTQTLLIAIDLQISVKIK